jgi:hypothetical protein
MPFDRIIGDEIHIFGPFSTNRVSQTLQKSLGNEKHSLGVWRWADIQSGDLEPSDPAEWVSVVTYLCLGILPC